MKPSLPPRPDQAPSSEPPTSLRFDPRQHYHLLNARDQTPIVTNAQVACSVWARMKGLLGRRALAADEALVIPHCRSIHTFGMRFPIDVMFVDRTWHVVALRPQIVPWRVTPPIWRAWGVVEAASGTLERAQLVVGDQLLIRPSQ